MADIKIKRIYDEPSNTDGYRVLVDRVWPRGLTKEKADIDVWLKDVGPTTALRKWFNHEVDKWPQFVLKYKAELTANAALQTLKEICTKHKTVTLLFGAKDVEHNQAVVLQKII